MRARTDEEIRRAAIGDVLPPREVDRWLAAHPKPTTLFEQSAIFTERMGDLAYALCKSLGVVWLVRRLGLTPRPWVLDRED